ncbi:MAG: protein-tyrosine phosphatase-like protein [Benjaminiella poitrasii]|nr:MAG: protein-tyrosine phosphatase-like protein [Benjaminiella poitrasii]
MINSNNKRLSLSIAPTTSTSSTLANRRRNNKNLSLCLSPDTTNYLSEPIKTANNIRLEKQQKDDINAYPLGPAKIMPYLYLGSEKNALDLDHLRQLHVQAILNVAAEVNNPYEYLFQSMDDMLAHTIAPSPSLSKASSISTQSTSSVETMTSIASNQPVAYQKLPWQHNQDNLVDELVKAMDVIDRARAAEQTILVHCQCGVARSATVIIAYVMKTLQLPLQEAYNHVKKLAPPISPNLGLLFQLREFEQTLLTSTNGLHHSCGGHPNDSMEDEAANPTVVVPTTKSNNSFLLRTSSFCALKRKLRSTTKSIFKSTKHDSSVVVVVDNANPSSNDTTWWKANRKVSLDHTATVAC